jgi:predicted NBD/HSP70 family sugar kinase
MARTSNGTSIAKKPVDVTALSERELQLAGLIWRKNALSRWEIHELTGLHPNLVGGSVQKLMDVGLLQEGPATAPASAGRPRVPLEIEDKRSRVIGVSIFPGEVRVQAVNLRGRALEEAKVANSNQGYRLIALGRELLESAMGPGVLAIGVCVTGFVDPTTRTLLFSSAAPEQGDLSLQPLFEGIGKTPLILENDMHALSAQWLLSQGDETDETLLVSIDDGRIGASMLIGGKPNRGCVTAANEIGHQRLRVETDMCYCGQIGCLERIFSTPQLKRVGLGELQLGDAMAQINGRTPAPLLEIADQLADGLANAANFMRPARLVLASPYIRHAGFTETLTRLVAGKLLPGLQDRVKIETWEHSCVQSAESAAWLALASFFGNAWK